MDNQNITVYGTSFCPKCKQLQTMCDKESIHYKYVNVEPGDPAFKMLLQENVKAFPAVNIGGKFILTSVLPDIWEQIQNTQIHTN